MVTVIELSEDGMIAISTSEADSEDESDTVAFTPGTATNITNPLNGETVEVSNQLPVTYIYVDLCPLQFTATVLSPTLMQTRSSGLETKTVEMKTWHFSYIGVAVVSCDCS